MAGRGSRLRPHTLTVPKPLIQIAGKPIVEHLVEDLCQMVDEKVEEIAFIIKDDFGKEVEDALHQIAKKQNATGKIYYQDEPLGTAHAILCAKDALHGRCIVAFADTLFKANFEISKTTDGVIYVHEVDDPSAFGVVKLDSDGYITDFVEKPTEFVSNKAIIGIYYFKDGEFLRNEMQYLIDNDIKDKGEYQITNALENMKNKGTKFETGKVEEWLDCGNYKACLFSNERVLSFKQGAATKGSNLQQTNATIIEPCFIGNNVKLNNAIVGPYVSIGNNTQITNAIISHAIVHENTNIKNVVLKNSMVGNQVELSGKTESHSIGDFNKVII